MLYYNTPLRLVLCLAIGLSATACNGINIDPEDWGIGGGGGSDDGDDASTADSASSSSQGGGSATAGSGGAGGDVTTAGVGGAGGGSTTGGAGGDATTAGSGGEGGSTTTTAGSGGEGGSTTTAGSGGEGGSSTTTAGVGGAGGGATTAGAGGAPPLDPACGPDTAAFADVAPILERSCSNQYCHGNASTPAGGLDLRTATAVSATVNRDAGSCSSEKALVVPFMPSSSYLMNKLTGVGLCNPDEFRMPLGTPLPDAEIKTINDWICAGAPDR
ncbi:hypothetical protein [Sorangium sp. So ce385]|uniref:hypothetical protein n=1 Tax=Sorangium sp. So ce385 TaxID=3133308 RepID=UPI003F5AE02F